MNIKIKLETQMWDTEFMASKVNFNEWQAIEIALMMQFENWWLDFINYVRLYYVILSCLK